MNGTARSVRASEALAHVELGVDRRLIPLRNQFEERAFAPQGARSSNGGGPAEQELVDVTGWAPVECTAEEHDEIIADAIRREAELDKIGQEHDDRRGLHVQFANHPICGSTLAWHLPGHRQAA